MPQTLDLATRNLFSLVSTYPLGMCPSISEHFISFWHKLFQAHLILIPEISHFSQEKGTWVPFNREQHLEEKIAAPGVLGAIEE